MVAAYTPTYYDEAVGLPAPEGIYGKEVHSTKTGAAQINEARLLLDLIQTQDPIQYAKLTDTSAPMPVLMKVPGQSKVRTRIAPNTGLTPIPSRSGLIYLTPSLYGTLLLVYFVLAILTILLPSEPIKCSKEAVCQLRPCFMVGWRWKPR